MSLRIIGAFLPPRRRRKKLATTVLRSDAESRHARASHRVAGADGEETQQARAHAPATAFSNASSNIAWVDILRGARGRASMEAGSKPASPLPAACRSPTRGFFYIRRSARIGIRNTVRCWTAILSLVTIDATQAVCRRC